MVPSNKNKIVSLEGYKKSIFYKTILSRKFKRHSEYVDFKYIANIFSFYLATTSAMLPHCSNNFGYHQILHSSYLAYKTPDFPVYAVKKDIAKALLETDIPEHCCYMKQAFQSALILLPRNLIKSPDGVFCDWVFLTHYLPGDESRLYDAEYVNFLQKASSSKKILFNRTCETTDKHKLRWVTQLYENYGYSEIIHFPQSAKYPEWGDFEDATSLPLNADLEKKFTNTVTKLVVNLLLYLQTPFSEKSATSIVSQNKNVPARLKSMGSSDKSDERDFIWIGNNYSQKKEYQGGTHATPSTHWRRGHWRNTLCGKGRQESKLVWIPPTLVCAE